MSDSLHCSSPGTEPTVDHLAKFCQSLPGMLPRKVASLGTACHGLRNIYWWAKFNFPEWVLTYDDTHQLDLRRPNIDLIPILLARCFKEFISTSPRQWKPPCVLVAHSQQHLHILTDSPCRTATMCHTRVPPLASRLIL
ncbi:hypothetical protein CEP53_001943 [Fusarium sp. AF-6]|nr:hypothetical protein CEP53_001943 [Fusarium sp. AF-6]